MHVSVCCNFICWPFETQLFSVFIPTLEAPEPLFIAHPMQHLSLTDSCALIFRGVYSRAAATLINFYEGVKQDTLDPYLDSLFERILKPFNYTNYDAKQPKRNVQKQAIMMLARVVDARETTFTKVDSSFIVLFDWLLINIFRINNATRASCHYCEHNA